MSEPITIKVDDINANETILSVNINDNDFPNATALFYKAVAELNKSEKFWKIHDDRWTEELVQENRDRIQMIELGCGEFDAHNDPSNILTEEDALERLHDIEAESWQHPPVEEPPELHDLIADQQRDRLREERADRPWQYPDEY